MSLRLALLDASHGAEHTRRNFRRELDADLAEFDVTDGTLPKTFDYDGVVVSGSRASAYDDEAWIASLVEWVSEAAERGLPILGVCYGHQILATALGGDVEPMDDIEIGYREVTHSGDDLFEGIGETFVAFTTHRDRVSELPPGATVLAENDYGIQAFRDGRCWGVQFHPEYDRTTAEEVTREKDLGEERTQRVLDGINPWNYEAACETKRLFENFTSHVRQLREDATSPESDPVHS